MELVEVEIDRLGLDKNSNAFVVVLKERAGERVLPIWIGQHEAESIVIEMHNIHRDRPLTHDLCKNIILKLGAVLRRVHITKVESRTYYAEMFLETHSELLYVDCRPSDSIAMAVRFNAPILVNEGLLASYTAQSQDNEDDSETDDSDSDMDKSDFPSESPMTPEELKAYLEGLTPEDFGKFHL